MRGPDSRTGSWRVMPVRDGPRLASSEGEVMPECDTSIFRPGRQPARRFGRDPRDGIRQPWRPLRLTDSVGEVNIIFVEPSFPANQGRFVHALASVGANVYGIGESDEAHLGDGRARCAARLLPRRIGDEPRPDGRGGPSLPGQGVDRRPRGDRRGAHDARGRRCARCAAIPGTSVRTTWLCRDKPSMRRRCASRVPTAASAAVDSAAEARAFASARATRSSSSRARAPARRERSAWTAMRSSRRRWRHTAVRARARSPSRSSSRATRASIYDTITPTADSCTTGRRTTTPTSSRRCATAGSRRSSSRRTASTSPATPLRRGPRPRPRVIEALGIETSATTWSGSTARRASSSARSVPGRLASARGSTTSAPTRSTSYREWAHVITHRAPEQQMKRTYAAGIVALRPDHDGSVTATPASTRSRRVRRVGHRRHFPPVGHGTQAVEAGYMANAWVRLRHPTSTTARAMLDDVGRTIHMHAG